MFPYSVTGTITQLVFHSMTTGNRSVAQIDPSVQGVFCPRPLHEMDAHTLIVCSDEFDAMTLHCKLKEIALTGYATISTLGTPSLECISPATKILINRGGPGRGFQTSLCFLRRYPPERFHCRLTLLHLLATCIKGRRTGVNEVQQAAGRSASEFLAGHPLHRFWTPVGSHIGEYLHRVGKQVA